ncbi:GSCFA domain-containing protein [Aurantibacillus circumpalustris]|uniref:GSCFA domain-containing protein n=1 Tax=Aurantibacillus circumpalustris TaxID=3036359 RepID=UPI00295A9AC5|nr:GSCFA domain-containing protein [Aurantibacillus circumpalustris]
MKFHLNYIPKKNDFEINHKDTILLMGSCFAENIGTQLINSKFRTCVNPNGILFNPTSIYNCIEAAVHKSATDESFILERNGLYYSYMHHGSFSSENKNQLLGKLNESVNSTHDFIKKTNVLIITFGSAFVYHHKTLNETVANCHKQASSNFEKRLLEVDEIVKTYVSLISEVKVLNPEIKIIFTVSPVKYLKEGVEENNLSKATLILSINKLVKENANCFYFPAYELVNDDLRDYRFYKEDLAHPNQQAVDYIWQKFSDCYFSNKTIDLNQQINRLQLALNHKPMRESSLELAKWQAFIENQKLEIEKLSPDIKF